MKIKPWQLRQRQSLDLEQKILLSKQKISEWYWHWGGNVYVSFSGGKDSTVMLDLVRQDFPDVPAVFVDTGLEYPEIREFVKTVDNVTWIKPAMTFPEVLKKYGYPVVSKRTSMKIYKYRTTKQEKFRRLIWNGCEKGNMSKLAEKWKFLVKAPFMISDKCCDVIKKRPFHKYSKETGRMPYVGTMASDGASRKQDYLRAGCNAFDNKSPMGKPLSIWLEEDIWEYIKSKKLPYSEIYDMGEKRTGCMFCMFGLHMEKGEDRFERMKNSHPKQFKYCMDNLGLRKIIKFVRSGNQKEMF